MTDCVIKKIAGTSDYITTRKLKNVGFSHVQSMSNKNSKKVYVKQEWLLVFHKLLNYLFSIFLSFFFLLNSPHHNRLDWSYIKTLSYCSAMTSTHTFKPRYLRIKKQFVDIQYLL